MVSMGNSQVGVSKLTNEVFAIMERLPVVVEGLTGVNVGKVTKFTKKMRVWFSWIFKMHLIICNSA